MNWDRVQGSWKQVKAKARVRWARLTDDLDNETAGRRELLAGKLQVAYGVGLDQAHRQVSDWQKSIQESANDADAIPDQATVGR